MTSRLSPSKGHHRIADEIQSIIILTNRSGNHRHNTQEQRIFQVEVSYYVDAADGLAAMIGFNNQPEKARALSRMVSSVH